jgi:hypothetical protein
MRPEKIQRTEDADVVLLAGWLNREPDVLRVLGPRSGNLAFVANILQVSVRSQSSSLRVSRDSFMLRLPSGETFEPLLSEEVVAAVSLPAAFSAASNNPEDRYAALIQMGIVGLAAAVERSGAQRYRDEARPDVQRKTMLPRRLSPGEQLDVLLVYLPKTGRISCSHALTIEAVLSLDGKSWKRTLDIDCR